MESQNKNNAQKIIESAMEKMNQVSTNQTVGSAIKNDLGQMVIPLSTVTVAVLSGGGEYGDIKIAREVGDHFAGGVLTVSSLKPSCFLVDNGSGFTVVNNNDILESFNTLIKFLAEKIK